MRKKNGSMKAAVFYGKNTIIVEEVPEPKISNEYDVKIKVAWCGICGSDVEEYLYGPIVTPTEPHSLTKEKIPLILGHEFCGEVVETGNSVDNISIGDKIVVFPILTCGVCNWCKQGIMCLCEKMACIGLQRNGAFAEYVVLPHNNCHKLKENEHFEKMALVEPAATAYRAVQRANINIGDNVVILGGGTIGLLVLQMVQMAGADKVIILEIVDEKSEYARQLGASAILNPEDNNLKEKILNITGDRDIDKVFECVGKKETPGLACDLVKKGGTVMLIGVSPEPSKINTTNVVISEKKIFGVHGYDSFNFEETLKLICENKLKVDTLITRKIYLDSIVKEGLEELIKNPMQNIKILVTPDKNLLT